MLDLIKGAAQAADTHLEELDPADIRTDGGTQMRAAINRETVEEYAQAMLAGDRFPPVVVYYDGSEHWLGDGFHRLAAWRQVMDDTIAAEVRAGTRRDAILLAAGANADHGLRRTNSDKRRAVLTLLQDDEWRDWSDREIARRCKVSNRFVTNLRAELQQAGQTPAPTVRKYTRNGEERTMETEKIGTTKPAPTVNGSQYEPDHDFLTLPETIQTILDRLSTVRPNDPLTLLSFLNNFGNIRDHRSDISTMPKWAGKKILSVTYAAALDEVLQDIRGRLAQASLSETPDPDLGDQYPTLDDSTVNGSQYEPAGTPETSAAPDPAPTSTPPPIAPPAPVGPAEGSKTIAGEATVTITVSRRTLLAVYELVASQPGRQNLTTEARAEFEVRAEEALGMTGAPPPLNPAAMEADLPDWRDLWDRAAENNHAALGAYWEVDDITSPALCLRLLEEDDGDLAPALRRRYLALTD